MGRNEQAIEIAAPKSAGSELAMSDAITLSRAEIDMQITTAKQYPRDIVRFERVALQMVEAHMALSKDPKDGLFYTLTKGGSKIEGPNVRLAEIIAHNWGNCRAGARSVGEDDAGKNVICEGVFHDLETNTAIRMYTKRRIFDKEGRRYGDDMVGVTENAGCGVAYRNAVLKGVPKVFWWPLYLKARRLAGGTTKADTGERRKKALETCDKLKIPVAAVLKTLGVKTTADIESDQLATLVGILTAVQHHETTLAKAFGLEETAAPAAKSAVKESVAGDVITTHQTQEFLTVMQDFGLKSMDMRRALDSIGHKLDLSKLPNSKRESLLKALEKMKKK